MIRLTAFHRILTLASVTTIASACSPDVSVAPEAPPESVAYALAAASGPAECVKDSKLLGRIELSTPDVPGTWWHLTREGLDAAGLTDYEATIEGWFGMQFDTLDEAIVFLVDQVRPLDVNENGYVCAYRVRGTRAFVGDPDFALTSFLVRDDKHAAP